MLKVMLVDDEVQIIKGMKASIDWLRVGCEVVCEAINGKDGLEKAMQFKPDIIITDITMPVMDGIEMSLRLREIMAGTKIIFLTCHEDFYYAKQALKLNISDYLVKETMQREELYAILKKTGKEIMEEKEFRDKSRTMTKELDENRILAGESIIKDMIYGNADNLPEIERRLEFYNYRLKSRYYLLSMLKVEKIIDLSSENDMNDFTHNKFVAFKTVSEILKKHYCGEVFQKNQDELVMVYYAPEPNPGMETEVYDISEEILESLKIKIRNKCTIYIGEAFDSLIKLSKVYNKMMLMDEKRFYLNDGTILRNDKPFVSFTDEVDIKNDFLMNYKEALHAFDLNRVGAVVIAFVEKSFQLKIVAREIRNTVERAFGIMTDVMEKYACNYSQLAQVPYNEMINDAADIFLLCNILVDFSKKAIELCKRNSDLIATSEIKKIVQYINLHIYENLTLDSMATLANMNSSYFSRYFKIKTGEKFVDYLSKVRIEKSKQLLGETYLTLDEILEKVGHVNKGYFIKVFKKAVGVSPAEYRRRTKNRPSGKASEQN